MHVGDVDEREAVLAANRAFYEAFERRDFDAMSDAWEHSDAVVCTHPGWRPLHGWAQVAG
ncbi:MAG: nuclear transport factor 2 family protein, partial [Acidimicrobiia bacterium]